MILIGCIFLYWYLGRLEKKQDHPTYIDKSVHYHYHDKTVLVTRDKITVDSKKVS